MRSLVCCPLCICKSYLVSRLLSVANTLVQRSKTLVQRCKHACAAFQNACSALHTRLFSVANPLVQRYRTLVQRCRRLCSAPHLHSLLTEGSAAWAVALKWCHSNSFFIEKIIVVNPKNLDLCCFFLTGYLICLLDIWNCKFSKLKVGNQRIFRLMRPAFSLIIAKSLAPTTLPNMAAGKIPQFVDVFFCWLSNDVLRSSSQLCQLRANHEGKGQTCRVAAVGEQRSTKKWVTFPLYHKYYSPL